MSYTIHYIDSEWVLRSACLQASFSPEDHTGDNIKLAVLATLQNWNLDIKDQVAITTDNASNIKLACRLLGCCQLSCFSHNLDLAVQRGLDDHRIERVLKVCRKIVATFSYSWQRRRQLLDEQQKRNLPTHKLKADVKTRWSSVYDMVQRIMEQKEALREVLSVDRSTAYLVLTWQDMDVLESVSTVLAPLRELTDLLAGEKKVTASAVIPLLQHLTNHILAASGTDNTLTTEIKERIKDNIESRYDAATKQLLEVCSFLDPRFKSTYVSSDTELIEKIKTEIPQMTTVTTSATNEVETESASKKRKTAWGKVFGAIVSNNDDSSGSLSSEEKLDKEIETYKHFPNLDVELSPLDWWKANNVQFPQLAQLARRYLTVCATSVSSERLFSKGGHIVGGRVQLKPEKVDQLIFLAQNLH